MNVDRLSRWYRCIEYAAFGRALERSRFEFLDRLATAQRILIFGEGDGRALARLLELAPQAQIDVVELSGAMIDLARKHAGGNASRVRFHQIDARGGEWPAGVFDGIVTYFFLDCFPEKELKELVGRIADRMTHNAVWLVADFAIPPAGWRRWHAALSIQIMYLFFRATTGLDTRSLPRIDEKLALAGMRRLAVVRRRAGLIQSEIWMKDYTC